MIAKSSLISETSEGPLQSPSQSNIAVYLVVFYMAWFITTPMYSSRFSFLAMSGFERVLAGVLIVFSALLGKWDNLYRPIPVLIGCLFAWMLISTTMTEYANFGSVLLWRETYWKTLVFFLCLTISIRNLQQLKIVVFGVAAVLLLYQLYSWFDFLNGGSYVYRQGMKRMTGTWAATGHGSGNAWGYLGLFGVPLSIACYRLATNRGTEIAAACFFSSTLLCIVFSGTRGALISAIIYLLYIFRKQILRPRYLLVFLIVGAFGLPLLPKTVQHRFISMVIPVEENEATEADKTASDSAKGRLLGLINGLKLAGEFPVFGCGPGASAQAAFELSRRRGESDENDGPMDLHNLYGQIPAEVGFVGLGIWVLLIVNCIMVTKRTQLSYQGNHIASSSTMDPFCSLILGFLAVLLIYGMAGHTLYDYRWLFVFGLANAISNIEK